MDAQHVFEVLDGKVFFVSRRHWSVDVFSVSDQADHRWVQVCVRDGADRHMLTIRLEPGAGSRGAISAIASWLHAPQERASQVLNVA